MIEQVLSELLWEAIRREYALSWDGLHGYSHWVRVWENGMRLATQNEADPAVVTHFAFLHDVKRLTDGRDWEHGDRAAHYIASLPDELLNLDAEQRTLLCHACARHTHGLTEGDITVCTCWDADRLDLGRVGIRPDPARMCTALGRDPEIIEWGWQRSQIAGAPALRLVAQRIAGLFRLG